MCAVSSTLFSYLRRVSEARVVSRVSMAYMLCTYRCCRVCVSSSRNILWRSKRILLLLYNCFRSSEVMDQMFFTVLGAVQGLFKSTLGVASVFDHVVLRPG